MYIYIYIYIMTATSNWYLPPRLSQNPLVNYVLLGSLGLSWALLGLVPPLGSPGRSWALLGSLGLPLDYPGPAFRSWQKQFLESINYCGLSQMIIYCIARCRYHFLLPICYLLPLRVALFPSLVLRLVENHLFVIYGSWASPLFTAVLLMRFASGALIVL